MRATHSRHDSDAGHHDGHMGRARAGTKRIVTALVLALTAFTLVGGGGPAAAQEAGPAVSGEAESAASLDEDRRAAARTMVRLLGAAREHTGLGAFRAVVRATDLTRLLEGDGPYTVFAPHNAAFARFSRTELGGMERGRRFVLGHVVEGRLTRAELARRSHVNTLDGRRPISIDREGDRIVIAGQAWIIGESIQTENGIIHVVNRVLKPTVVRPGGN